MNETNSVSFCEMSVQQALEVSPKAHNLQMAIEKGLAEREIYDADYLKLQAAYTAVVNHYLCLQAGLDGYQELLDTNSYNFAKPEANVYTLFGSFGRKNIFIRNCMYIEQLSEEDIALLRDNIQEQRVCLENGVLEMVKRTLPQVITVKYDGEKVTSEVIYDAGVFQTNIAPGDALVLEIAYEFDYDEKGNLIDRELEKSKLTFVQALADMMAAEMEEKLSLSVRVFVN